MSARETLKRFIRPLLIVWLGLAAISLVTWIVIFFLPDLITSFGVPSAWLVEPIPTDAAYIAGGVFLFGAWVLPLLYWRRRQAMIAQQKQIDQMVNKGHVLLLLPRVDADLVDPEAVSLWTRMAHVIPMGEHIAFEVSGNDTGILFSMKATPETSQATLTQIFAEWTNSQARSPSELQGETPDPITMKDGQSAWQIEMSLASGETPISLSSPDLDPMLTFLSELGRMPQEVRAGMQVLVRHDLYTQATLAAKAAQLTSQGTPMSQAGAPRVLKSSEQKRMEKTLDERAQRPYLETRIIVWAIASDEALARTVTTSLARNLSSSFGQSNPLRPLNGGWKGAPFHREFPVFRGEAWADRELGMLAHLVGGKSALDVAPHLKMARARNLPPTLAARIPKGARTIFALIAEAEKEHPAALSPAPDANKLVASSSAVKPQRAVGMPLELPDLEVVEVEVITATPTASQKMSLWDAFIGVFRGKKKSARGDASQVEVIYLD